ncbi:MAG: MFS transporter [Betaproteobacteria bacterium]
MQKLLKNRHFAPLWVGQSLSEAGNWLRHMTLTYWVYQTSGHSPVATASMVVATYAPLLFGPLAGVLVNRWSHRRTMLWAQALCAGCSALLAAALRTQSLVLIYTFLSSTVSQFYTLRGKP